MQRREFLATAGAVGLTTAALGSLRAADVPAKKDYLELRIYTAKDADKKAQLIEAIDKALVPALNRLEIKPVGVFSAHENEKNFQENVFVLFPHKNLDSVATLSAKLLADKTFTKDGAAVFGTTSKDPLYTTYESELYYGFDKCPTIETPVSNKERIFQLRVYRSFNIDKNAKKVHMFDEGGELPLFRKVGMNPVFFGDALFGTKMPNLTYMLGFENEDVRKKAWDAFIKSPEWQEIKTNPMYADTATEIVNIFLKPSDGSQV